MRVWVQLRKQKDEKLWVKIYYRDENLHDAGGAGKERSESQAGCSQEPSASQARDLAPQERLGGQHSRLQTRTGTCAKEITQAGVQKASSWENS